MRLFDESVEEHFLLPTNFFVMVAMDTVVNKWKSVIGQNEWYSFLADRTNGRAIATLLRLSSVTLCTVAKRCVVEQKLLLRAYRKSYMRNRLVPK